MSAPPVPPRPPTTQPAIPSFPSVLGGQAGPPPLPPLPPGFRPDIDGHKESPPHFGDPILAPRPQKLLSSVPAEVSSLDQAPSRPVLLLLRFLLFFLASSRLADSLC